jgi:hypothetical protein
MFSMRNLLAIAAPFLCVCAYDWKDETAGEGDTAAARSSVVARSEALSHQLTFDTGLERSPG